MLNEEERREFLAKLIAFLRATSLSGLAAGDLFGVSNATIARWTREPYDGSNISRYMAQSVADKIDTLNRADADHSLYAGLRDLRKGERVPLLRNVLNGTVTW